jgi:hypothetical protein
MHLIISATDKQKAIEILAEEYLNANNVTWMFRKKTKRNVRMLFKILFNEAKAKKGAFITESSSGVLFLYRQDIQKQAFANFFLKLYVLLFVAGISRGLKALKWQKTVNSIRPKEGMLGIAFAISNDENKMKTSFEIKREIKVISTESKLTIYAETTVPRIKILYESIGFEVYHEMEHEFADLRVWFLKSS